MTSNTQRPSPGDPWRFICDQHLGKLARLLRIMGFDTAYGTDWLEPEMARRAVNEDRIVLSRNRQLLQRKALTRALLITSDQPDEQAREVLQEFQLADQVRPFGRCTRCNGLVEPVAKAQILELIPPRTRRWLDTYTRCTGCGHIYWEGTHVTALLKRLTAIQAGRPGSQDPELGP
jgi:hypothetical protein